MSGRKLVAHKLESVHRAPEGESFVWLTLGLVASPAWRGRSIHCVRLIDFLMIENMRDAGKENGNLGATYDQLEAFGIGRPYISAAIAEAEARKLITVHRGGPRATVKAAMSRYRLTWLASKEIGPDDKPYYVRGTDDWKRVSEATARKIAKQGPKRKPPKNKTPVHTLSTKAVHTL